jgi:prepilin peptidase CpaA
MIHSLSMIDPSYISWGVVLFATSVAAITDLRSRRIPNVLTLGTCLGGLAVAVFDIGTVGPVESFFACLILALPYVLLYCFAGGGAGDAKLMGAIGAWLGFSNGLSVLLCVCLAGMAQALIVSYRADHLILLYKRLRHFIQGLTLQFTAPNGSRPELRHFAPPVEGSPTLPYGVSILAGTLGAAGLSLL